MPIDYKKYPFNWKTEIRPAILRRAGYRCEICRVKNHATGYRDKQGKFIESCGMQQEADTLDGAKIITIVLTVAHLNHDITDNRPENLKALCQKCHLSHDAGHHASTRKYGNNQNQLTLL
jgi:5-methylcytosine-specific restriction endonuclease McrA